MSQSNKLLPLEVWFPVQGAGVRHSSRQFFNKKISAWILTHTPAFTAIAALHEKEGLEIQLTAPYLYLKGSRYIYSYYVTSVCK